MELFGAGNRGQDRGAARGKERRGGHQQRAEGIQHPYAVRYDSKDEAESDERADEIAGDHDPLAVPAIEHHSGQRPHGDRRDGARQQHAGHHHARMGKLHGQREDGDAVEVIADFADNLARPHEAIIAIPAKQLEEFAHQPARVREVLEERAMAMCLISISVSKPISESISSQDTICHASRNPQRWAGLLRRSKNCHRLTGYSLPFFFGL